MELNEEEFAEFEQILQALAEDMERDDTVVINNSAKFVKDQAERYKTYRADTHLSEKQWAWLRDLYRRATGRAKEGEDDGFKPVDEHWRDKL
jgi:hypothetical protein